MLRNSLIGHAVFGLSAAAAGYIWTAFEFPFAILIPAALGWYAVVRPDYGNRKALWAALVGGVSFLGAFLLATFFALTDGSPVALTAWMSATLAAGVAGAATGWLLDGARGSLAIALFSAVGMLAATVVAGVMRTYAPGAVDVAGPTQFAYFALVLGVVGAFVGAAVGAGTSWVSTHRRTEGESSHSTIGTPHAV